MDRENLKSLLECPVCFEIRRDTNIFQCREGHIICASCKANKAIVDCHTCRGPYTDPPIRCLHVEKMIAQSDFDFPCKFAWDGCTMVAVNSRLQTHEVDCPYMRLNCLRGDCRASILAKDLLEHLADFHVECKNSMNGCQFTGGGATVAMHEKECVPCPEGYCKKYITISAAMNHIRTAHTNAYSFPPTACGEYSTQFSIKNYDSRIVWVLSLYQHDGQTILHHFERSNNGIYYFFFKIFGDQKLADKYSIEIGAQGNDGEFRRRCKMHPLAKRDEEIMKDVDCFQLSDVQVRQFMVADGVSEEQRSKGFTHQIKFKLRLITNGILDSKHTSGEKRKRALTMLKL